MYSQSIISVFKRNNLNVVSLFNSEIIPFMIYYLLWVVIVIIKKKKKNRKRLVIISVESILRYVK